MKSTISKFISSIPNHIWIGFLAILVSFVLIIFNREGVVFPSELNIGFLTFNFYGLIIALSAIVAGMLIEREFKDRGWLDGDTFWTVLLLVVLLGLIGARIFHVISAWTVKYSLDPISSLYFWDGGLAIQGGILFGLVVTSYICSKYKLPFWNVVAIVSLYIPLAQILGRFGNFVNQEIYGYPTDLPWAIFISEENRVVTFELFQYFHPTFFYEQIGSFIVMVILWYYYRSFNSTGVIGERFHAMRVVSIYILGYGLVRIIMEQIRIENVWMFGMTFGEVLSAIMVIIALVINIYIYINKKKFDE